MENVMVSVRLTSDILADVHRVVARAGVSPERVIRAAVQTRLRKWLENGSALDADLVPEAHAEIVERLVFFPASVVAHLRQLCFERDVTRSAVLRAALTKVLRKVERMDERSLVAFVAEGAMSGP